MCRRPGHGFSFEGNHCTDSKQTCTCGTSSYTSLSPTTSTPTKTPALRSPQDRGRKPESSPQSSHTPYAVDPITIPTPSNKLINPIINVSNYSTSFLIATTPSPKLYTPPLYLTLEAFFQEPITRAADIWTLGVNLYDAVSKRPLFETFAYDPDDIIAEMVSTLGMLSQRWWDSWENRGDFFEQDAQWSLEKGGLRAD